MSKKSTLQIVTANDLFEGDVVYLTADGGWSRWHEDAAVAEDKDAAAALLARGAAQQDRVVGPYLAAAERGADGRPVPVHYREAMRTQGPSVRRDLGKQAEPVPASSDRAA